MRHFRNYLLAPVLHPRLGLQHAGVIGIEFQRPRKDGVQILAERRAAPCPLPGNDEPFQTGDQDINIVRG